MPAVCQVAATVGGMAIWSTAPGTSSSSVQRCIEDWLRNASAGSNHIRDMDRGELNFHINILEMKEVQLVLNACRDCIMGEFMLIALKRLVYTL